ncbi:MAG TPA: hypothetical protein VGJ34_04575 [Gaiellaceae bacterium]
MPIEEQPSEDLLRRLVEEARGRGEDAVVVEASREVAEAWMRTGFAERARILEAPVDNLERRLSRDRAPSFGSIHVQTDDVDSVVRAVHQFVPRMPGSSKGSVVAPPRNGWMAVYDELCDRDPEMLRRLARELSDRMGAVVLLLGVEQGEVVRFVLFERARIMDEYLSVPEYHGELPPGDVIALSANPTVVARLTGADPTEVRRVVRTAKAPEELSPASELVAEVAAVLGVEGADHGYASAEAIPGAMSLPRE